jgi:hypothetical protein
MTRKHGETPRRKHGRTPAQRQWTSALGRASIAWEYLSEEQRLLWKVDAEVRRTSGQRCFVKVNAPRLRGGLELLTKPPKLEPYNSKRALHGLAITHRRGRIVLKLAVSPMPGARYTVWGSRPCKLGVSAYIKCPLLGLLPPPVDGRSDITALYFRKHGDYIMQHELPLVRRRIYIRIRQERDQGPALYEEVRAIVPDPEDDQD